MSAVEVNFKFCLFENLYRLIVVLHYMIRASCLVVWRQLVFVFAVVPLSLFFEM